MSVHNIPDADKLSKDYRREKFLEEQARYEWKGWSTFYKEAIASGRTVGQVIVEAENNGWNFIGGTWRRKKTT